MKRITKYYCNCCGADFTKDESLEKHRIVCPECGCESDTKGVYIEEYQEEIAK